MKISLFALALISIATLATTASVYAQNEQANATCESDSHYPVISKADLKHHVDAKDAFIIDVNSSESFKEVHVPNAIHFADHKSDFAKLLPAQKDALIVAYCGGPKCEAWLNAAKKACELGYTNIQHFKDGISGWKKI
jgi:rhodanese-related sulfurtransferase